MSRDPHFAGLERAYVRAAINQWYRPRIEVAEATAAIELDLEERFHHAMGAVHGSVYFKMLDDAAFFAANSLEREVFLVTSAFTIYLTRPVVSGTIRSEGRLADRTRTQFIAEAVLRNGAGREIGRGSGVFMRSGVKLVEVPGYLRET